MVNCPRCEFANPAGAAICSRCGYAASDASPPAVVVCEAGSADVPMPAGALDAPLPQPMVEPIQHPPSDGEVALSCPALTLSLREKAAGSPASAKTVVGRGGHTGPPSADTLRERPAATPSQIAPTAQEFPAPAHTPPPSTPSQPALPSRPKLVVLRGQRVNAEYPVYEGRNTIGRFADKPVDIDLLSQEAEGQVWSSRQHAAITFDRGLILVEDLNSLNGTWVNGVRVHAGQQRMLKPNDVIQIGNVQLKLVVG